MNVFKVPNADAGCRQHLTVVSVVGASAAGAAGAKGAIAPGLVCRVQRFIPGILLALDCCPRSQQDKGVVKAPTASASADARGSSAQAVR